MEGSNENQDIEFEYATKLFNQKILPGPGQCDCGYSNFEIQIYKSIKTSGKVLRCSNNICRKRYPIRVNSFFSLFPRVRLDVCSEIIKAFICLEFNIS